MGNVLKVGRLKVPTFSGWKGLCVVLEEYGDSIRAIKPNGSLVDCCRHEISIPSSQDMLRQEFSAQSKGLGGPYFESSCLMYPPSWGKVLMDRDEPDFSA